MEVLHSHCAGLDVHKDTVVACVRRMANGSVRHEVRTFKTTTKELLALSVAAGIYGFARIRRERPGATVFGPPAIEQINEAGHEAGASA